jgi:L-ribulose-5-phosphate 3-epimerase
LPKNALSEASVVFEPEQAKHAESKTRRSMSRLKIGICLESLGMPLRQALAAAVRTGVTGVQIDAAGDLSPNKLSQTGRRELRHLLGSHDLEVTAVNCPLRRGLDAAEDQQPRIEHVKKVMSLAFELGPRIVVIQAGRVPSEDEEKNLTARSRLLAEALQALGPYGDRIGVALALETGLESGAQLRDYLKRFDAGSIGVNYDPANLLMNGFDPIESMRDLKTLVRHAHAKDARLVGASRSAREVPLGHGDIDWLTLLSVFEEVEYRGWLAVERESGDDRPGDIAAGVAFLRRLIGA